MRTRRGRRYVVVGDAGVVTLDRQRVLEDRLDSDPRIASVSVVAHESPNQEFLRATSPSGCTVLLAVDFAALVGSLSEEPTTEDVKAWARSASERGLWHDWWLSDARDIQESPTILPTAELDSQESQDRASSHFLALSNVPLNGNAISITVDATWLGPHQTGAQVLTTAAIEALAHHPHVDSIHLVGLQELPTYAEHLTDLSTVRVGEPHSAADVLWYPNQIDQRVDISRASRLGRRVVTTYLDLIAYDIPRYHTSADAWAAYRSLQRRIALSVDGITTISADVAKHLLEEVPLLDPSRVRPIPLGLDHISVENLEPADDIKDLRNELGSRPFLLVLGNDFQHKNRDFAVRVWEEVLARSTNCDLVLAGLHVKSSSSRDLEEELVSQHTNLRGRVFSVGHVRSSSRSWLMSHAAAVLYPSSAEGFGFVPYEAAALGTPSTFTSFGPLREIARVPDVPRSWSIEAYADDVRGLLEDPEKARERVSALRSAISTYTWQRFAEQLVDFLVAIDTLPPAPGSLVGGGTADAAALASILNSRTWRATAALRRLGGKARR